MDREEMELLTNVLLDLLDKRQGNVVVSLGNISELSNPAHHQVAQHSRKSKFVQNYYSCIYPPPHQIIQLSSAYLHEYKRYKFVYVWYVFYSIKNFHDCGDT